MNKNFSQLNPEDQLKAENDFLKMKLMLENGAEFKERSSEIPPEIENQFLKNILEFESQFASHKTIKVFDRIGKPFHFKKVADIRDDEIKQSWIELEAWLNDHGVMLDVCNPKISERELYRFATEELFEYEMEDIRIPGMMHGFIYDEFYPDPVYDNTNRCRWECLHQFFCLDQLQTSNLPHFKKSELRLNEHYPITIEDLVRRINRFKSAYDQMEVLEVNDTGCTRTETAMVINGTYLVHVVSGNEQFPLTGTWQIDFDLCAGGEWMIHRVQIENIRF